MKYSIIGDEDTVLGFGIVGVLGHVATTPDEVKEAFDTLIQDKEIAIIIMTERLADMIRPIVNTYLFTDSFPLIVEVPDRTGVKPGRPGIKDLVNAAIGIKL